MVPLATAVALSLLPPAARHTVALALDRRASERAAAAPPAGPAGSPPHLARDDRSGRRPAAGGPPLSTLLRAIGIDSSAAAARAAELEAAAAAALERASAQGLAAVARGDAAYPPLVAAAPDPPFVLWVRGRLDLLCRPAVAIVGTRRASVASLVLARSLARDLAGRGLVVVSGLARGVDAAAHEGALEVQGEGAGSTVAVVGCGADVVYPREHAALHARIGREGAVASEFPPGTPARAFHFPIRNRLVSGLALGVVVIEAPERSGALITAACALEQGREVMVVPGPARSERFRGSHALLRDGAALVEEAADVLAVLGWRSGAAAKAAAAADPGVAAGAAHRAGHGAAGHLERPGGLGTPAPAGPARAAIRVEDAAGAEDPASGEQDPAAAAILRSWRPGVERDFAELLEVLGLEAPAALARLAGWELAGLVARTAAGRFVRLPDGGKLGVLSR